MMVMPIEKLLEEIEDLKNEYDFVTDEKILKFPKGETINLSAKIVESPREVEPIFDTQKVLEYYSR